MVKSIPSGSSDKKPETITNDSIVKQDTINTKCEKTKAAHVRKLWVNANKESETLLDDYWDLITWNLATGGNWFPTFENFVRYHAYRTRIHARLPEDGPKEEVVTPDAEPSNSESSSEGEEGLLPSDIERME